MSKRNRKSRGLNTPRGQTKMELYDPLEESDRPIGSLSEDRTCLWDGDKMIPRFGLEGQSLSRRYPQ